MAHQWRLAILWTASAFGSETGHLGVDLVHFLNRPYPERPFRGLSLCPCGSVAEPVSTAPVEVLLLVGAACVVWRFTLRWLISWSVITGCHGRRSCPGSVLPLSRRWTTSWNSIVPWPEGASGV